MPIEKDGDRKPNLPKPQTFSSSLISFILFLLLLNFLVLPSLRPRPTRVPYSTFIRQVKDGKVYQAYIKEDEIRYTLKQDATGSQSAQPAAPAASPSPATTEKSPSPQASGQVLSPQPSPSSSSSQESRKPAPIYYTIRIDASTSDLVKLLEQENVEFGAAPPDQGIFSRPFWDGLRHR